MFVSSLYNCFVFQVSKGQKVIITCCRVSPLYMFMWRLRVDTPGERFIKVTVSRQNLCVAVVIVVIGGY